MDYAIIRVGGKQHRVRDGETLVVDRLRTEVGGTFAPDVLLGEDGAKVVITVLSHERGPKIRIGKYRKRTGYKRHNGFRAATSRIEVSFGGEGRRSAPARAAKPQAEEVVQTPTEVEVEAPVTAEAVEAAAVEAAAVETEPVETEPTEAEVPEGLPEGYADMTVADIGKSAKDWTREELDAARAYEEANAARKGALGAIDSALAADDEGDS
jgi:large subunit ribosomal protein L21